MTKSDHTAYNMRMCYSYITSKCMKSIYSMSSILRCDSTSTFHGYSKVSSWNILLHEPTSVAVLTSLGAEFSFEEQFEKEIEAAV